MFKAGSQDFCSRLRRDKHVGFIDFCAVQHDFVQHLWHLACGVTTSRDGAANAGSTVSGKLTS
jgi:hypothetical protein